jgi:hypothetical protein
VTLLCHIRLVAVHERPQLLGNDGGVALVEQPAVSVMRVNDRPRTRLFEFTAAEPSETFELHTVPRQFTSGIFERE